MNIIIDQEFKGLIPALLPDELRQLEANVIQDGCLDPLTVWRIDGGDAILIDGHNRHGICQRNGIEFDVKEKNFPDREHVKLWIGEHQLGRRNLTDDQRAIVANDVRETRSAIARVERAKEARASVQDRNPVNSDLRAKSAHKSEPQLPSRAAVAKETNLPERKIRLAQEIKKAAPKVHEMVRAGTVSLTEGKKLASLPVAQRVAAVAAVTSGEDVKAAVRAAKRDDYNDRISATKPKPLEGTYRIFYADPPWKYVGLNGNDDHGHAEAHYDCLDDEQLKVYRPGGGDKTVTQMADANSVLFMWVTSPLLARCFPIIDAWGFEYKSSFVWDKVKHNMGHYNSVRHELLLICTRGSCKPDVPKLIDSVQSIERSNKHSQKPQEFYEIIESLYDHGRKLELFCREKREGWDADGNEV
jgi:N6-adenosine-specific RNA methylase IME4